MHRKIYKNNQAFTLVELLIVIAIVAIIAAVVFVALDPLRRFRDARDSQRWSDIVAIVDALKLYQIDNGGNLPAGIDENWRMLGTNTSGCDAGCGGGTETVVVTDISSRVISSTDDAEEQDPPGGYVSRASTDLELVNDATTNQEVGMRFQSIDIPAGATIDSAYIDFVVDEADSGVANLIFYGEDVDDADNFSDIYGDISSRVKTSSSVSWSNIAEWTTAGEIKSSPNIASIVQEIVDRPGWVSGNDIVIIVTGSGERTAESYDGSSAEAPLLSVSYSETTTSSSGGESFQPSCLDISSDLSAKLSSMPYDPALGDSGNTYYAIRKKENGTIEVYACGAEGDDDIRVIR